MEVKLLRDEMVAKIGRAYFARTRMDCAFLAKISSSMSGQPHPRSGKGEIFGFAQEELSRTKTSRFPLQSILHGLCSGNREVL
jgi:hypothetical protein